MDVNYGDFRQTKTLESLFCEHCNMVNINSVGDDNIMGFTHFIGENGVGPNFMQIGDTVIKNTGSAPELDISGLAPPSDLLAENNTWTGTNEYTQPITTSKVTNNSNIAIESVSGEVDIDAGSSIYLNPGSGALALVSASPRFIFGQTNPPIIRSVAGTDTNFIDIPRVSGFVTDTFVTSLVDQDIDGIKTFNACPLSTVAPTVGDHLCNKTYVDSIASGPKATMVARKTSENTVNNTSLTSTSVYYSASLSTITQSYSAPSSDLTITINSSGIINFNNTSGSTKDVRILLDFGFWTSATTAQTLSMRWSHDTGVTWKFFYSSSAASVYQKESWIQYYSIPAGSTNTQIQIQTSTSSGISFSITSLQVSVDEL